MSYVCTRVQCVSCVCMYAHVCVRAVESYICIIQVCVFMHSMVSFIMLCESCMMGMGDSVSGICMCGVCAWYGCMSNDSGV